MSEIIWESDDGRVAFRYHEDEGETVEGDKIEAGSLEIEVEGELHFSKVEKEDFYQHE